MKRTFFKPVFIVLLFAVWIQTQAIADMKAGAASVVITPDEYIWMSGYAARTAPANGKLHDLYAKALALEDESGNKAVIVTTDLIGVTAKLTGNVCRRVKEKTSLPREAIMLTSSHTHSGPVLRQNLETMYELDQEMWKKITDYTNQLEDKLVNVILAALEDIEPVFLYRGNGTASFGKNRRIYTENGMSFGINPIGPVDHDVPTMRVVTNKGKQKALLFGYACHNTTLDGLQYCGDYAGFTQAYLDQAYPGSVNMFFSGCGGDINPQPRREIALAKQHGKKLSVSVQKVVEGVMIPVDGNIKTAFSILDVPLTKAPTREEVNQRLKHENKYERLLAQDLLERLDNGGIKESYPYPVQVWKIADLLMISLGGEVVVDYALLMKHLYGRDTWVIAYSNDVMAYIPSLRVLQEGGYEGGESMKYYGIHGPWKPQIQELIVSEIKKLVNAVQ